MTACKRITLGHGSGGALTAELLREVILPVFTDVRPTDGAVLDVPAGQRLVLTTDTYVVDPLFFPGGDIGLLAVHGTLNDLAMMGAAPAYLTCGLVIEEGFPLADLAAICRQMREAADRTGARIVAGDTKVVRRGEAAGLYVNTTGAGFVPAGLELDPSFLREGDALIVDGDLGRHGTAVLAARLGVSFKPPLLSDTGPLRPEVDALWQEGISPRVMRDLTRGGLAAVANELVSGRALDLILHEESVPIEPRVGRACEIWGLDPLDVACEGRFLAVVPGAEAERTVAALAAAGAERAAIIGTVAAGEGRVMMRTVLGGRRPVRPARGELLPRIC